MRIASNSNPAVAREQNLPIYLLRMGRARVEFRAQSATSIGHQTDVAARFILLLSDFRSVFFDTGHRWEVRGNLESAQKIRDDYLALNPNMIFLAAMPLQGHEGPIALFGDDWPYWVRDTQGAIIIFNAPFLPQDQAHGLIDFTHPDIQNHIIQQAIAVSKCGLYDGVFMDWWSEDGPVLRSGKNGFEAEQRARDNIIKGIRNNVRPDFLIMVNTNERIIPRTAPYINGAFMETRTPGTDGAAAPNALATLQRSLSWLEQNLREPRVNALEGGADSSQPPDSPTNLRWMRAVTTLSLTHSDGYIMFRTGLQGHGHYWYDFWDADLGRPVGEKAQVYEGRDGLYIREYTNGWAAYNHSGAPAGW